MKLAILLLVVPLSAAAVEQSDLPEITMAPGTIASQPSKSFTAQGMDLVNGAIVCSSYDLAEFLYGQINAARHARASLPVELRRQATLINGYDYGQEPRPSDYGCVMVPIGTRLSVEKGNLVPVVSGKLPDGRKFMGVTLPTMIAH